MNPLKRLYNWILGWSESRWGALALFLLAFAESSFFPIPPDVLLIALCLGCAAKAFRYAAICTVGSLLGHALPDRRRMRAVRQSLSDRGREHCRRAGLL